jgi:hypothetical protein
MLWSCIDMRLAVMIGRSTLYVNGYAQRALKVATALGCDPYLVGASSG